MSKEQTGFKRSPVRKARAEEDFIAGAGKPILLPSTDFPWDGLDNEKRRELYNLRLTEAEKAKLEFVVSKSTYKSMQEYCLEILLPAIEADIKRLTE